MSKDTNFALNGIDVIKLSDKNFLRILENGGCFMYILLCSCIYIDIQPSRNGVHHEMEYKPTQNHETIANTVYTVFAVDSWF
jgi:hypothetical protein